MNVNIKIEVTPDGKNPETMEINIKSSPGFKSVFDTETLMSEARKYAAYKMSTGPIMGPEFE